MRIEEITLVVPTRNEERNIGAFLARLPQALPIIVVDASEDRTPEIVTAARRPACTLVRRPANVSEARQLGADLATTPWLLFTDADVELPPDYFERLSGHSDCHALYGPKLSRDAFRRYYRGFALAQSVAHRLGVPAASGSNLLVRRQVLETIGGFDPKLSCNEDSEIAWRIKRAGYRVDFDPKLRVYATDHRRLNRGVWRKTMHSLVRCLLLYLDLIPSRWRGHDWGYWRSTAPSRRWRRSRDE